MFALPFRDSSKESIQGDLVMLRHPAMSDFNEWATLRLQSRTFLQPWEPRWGPNDLSRSSFRGRLRRYNHDIEKGIGLPFFVFQIDTGTLVGGITLGNIRRGVSQSAQIGYWMGEPYAQKGFMTDALNAVCKHAFTRCGLHRLEAACIPENTRSIKLLEKCGFMREGHLSAYLKIDGRWRDHFLYALVNPAD